MVVHSSSSTLGHIGPTILSTSGPILVSTIDPSVFFGMFLDKTYYIYIYVRLYILLYNVLYLNGLRCQARAKRSFCFFFVRKFLEGLRAVVEGLPAFGEGLTVFHWFLFDADYTENVMKHGHLSSAWTQDRLSAPARNVKISNGL